MEAGLGRQTRDVSKMTDSGIFFQRETNATGELS